jgi:hypothetical protein
MILKMLTMYTVVGQNLSKSPILRGNLINPSKIHLYTVCFINVCKLNLLFAYNLATLV